jgi:hypothetical protein
MAATRFTRFASVFTAALSLFSTLSSAVELQPVTLNGHLENFQKREAGNGVAGLDLQNYENFYWAAQGMKLPI